MVRNGLFVLVGAGLLFGLTLPAGSAPGEDTESRLQTQLAVQTALQQGRDNLQRGNYQGAVYCLEREIARVDGNHDYLNVLREAYRGHIHELRQANKTAEARKYQERLAILDPGSRIERGGDRPTHAPTNAALAAQSIPTPSTPIPPAKPSAPNPSAAYTARPQMPEERGDPFDDSNSVQQPQVRELLDRAKLEHDKKNYPAANRLFEQVNRVDPRAVVPFRDLWAFCKLYSVADVVNKAGGVPPAQAEKEVLAALALASSPQLENYGKGLLHSIQNCRLVVRHVSATAKTWPEAETPNFRIIHNQSRDLAEQAARIAETTRAAVTRKWFGEEPTAWTPKCRIILYAAGEHYARDTGTSATSPGHTTMKTDKDNFDRVVDRRIDLHCDVKDMLTNVLPHETTHAVLCGRFGRHVIPRWVDEGIAVLTEPRDKIELHLKNLPMHRYKRELIPLSELMTLKDYPQPRSIGTFYAQSISLVEFLSSQKGGPVAFTRFVRDGLDNGYEAALRRHYGIQDFKDLEQRWYKAAFGEIPRTAAMYEPRR